MVSFSKGFVTSISHMSNFLSTKFISEATQGWQDAGNGKWYNNNNNNIMVNGQPGGCCMDADQSIAAEKASTAHSAAKAPTSRKVQGAARLHSLHAAILSAKVGAWLEAG